LRLARSVLMKAVVVAGFVRVILWVLLVIAPGGIFLLPLLLGDAMARRRRVPQESIADVGSVVARVDPVATPVSGR